jgi:hypothetical protein
MATDFVVLGPVRNQAKPTNHRLTIGYRLIAHIGVEMAPNEYAAVAGPEIGLSSAHWRVKIKTLPQLSWVSN